MDSHDRRIGKDQNSQRKPKNFCGFAWEFFNQLKQGRKAQTKKKIAAGAVKKGGEQASIAGKTVGVVGVIPKNYPKRFFPKVADD